MGSGWCYGIFAIVCGLGIAFVFLVVPETKGRSLDEIQESFSTNTNESTGNGNGKENAKTNPPLQVSVPA